MTEVSPGIASRPALTCSFRLPFERHRCLIPLDGFKDGALMAMAGLWDTCKTPSNKTVRSATIITCPPKRVHCFRFRRRCRPMPLIELIDPERNFWIFDTAGKRVAEPIIAPNVTPMEIIYHR